MVQLAFVAALIAALGAAKRPAREYREPGPLPSAQEPAAPSLRALILGDFGDPTPQQRRVAVALLRWHAERPFDLALQPGDNVYNCGPDPRARGAGACRFARDDNTVEPGFEPPRDRLFEKNEAPLRALRRRDGSPVPVYLALGNHDVGAERFCKIEGMARGEWMRRRACLEVAHRSPTWRMPARHYVVDEGRVRFIVVDSNVAFAEYGGFTFAGEEAFVREASADCVQRLCFLVAHHPPAMAVGRPLAPGEEQSLTGMRRLIRSAGGRLAAVITGHAHALEHLTYGDVDVLITGSGARPGSDRITRGWPADAQLHFASNAGGFGVLEVRPGGWSYRMVDTHGRSLHCCDATGRGPCRPVVCPTGGA
jgi:3',5'-cyclic AMP phosphodiesterase CpdA